MLVTLCKLQKGMVIDMTKNDVINDVVSSLVMVFKKEDLEIIKSTFIVKMQGYEIHETCTLPSTEVRDNEFIFKRFMIDMLAKGLKQSTIKSYMNYVKPFFDYTKLNYREVTAQNITDYIAIKRVTKNKKGELNSQNYLCNINKALSIFFKWAYKKHHIEVDIINDVETVKPKQKKKDRLSKEEMEACREVTKNIRERALLELMFSTGLRVGEIVALKVEHIEFKKRTVHILEGKSDSAERDVYLTVRARNCLLKYLNGRNDGYVFRPSKNSIDANTPIGTGTIEKWTKEIGKRAGCHCDTTVHVFRKTFASTEYERTGNSKYVSIVMGHSSTAVTERNYVVDNMNNIAHIGLSA